MGQPEWKEKDGLDFMGYDDAAKGDRRPWFQDFQAFNDAFLGKLSWRIMNNPDILLPRVLLGIYCSDESFIECTDKSSSSHGWKGVLIGRYLLAQNLGCVVGSGTSITAWYSPWLSLT